MESQDNRSAIGIMVLQAASDGSPTPTLNTALLARVLPQPSSVPNTPRAPSAVEVRSVARPSTSVTEPPPVKASLENTAQKIQRLCRPTVAPSQACVSKPLQRTLSPEFDAMAGDDRSVILSSVRGTPRYYADTPVADEKNPSAPVKDPVWKHSMFKYMCSVLLGVHVGKTF